MNNPIDLEQLKKLADDAVSKAMIVPHPFGTIVAAVPGLIDEVESYHKHLKLFEESIRHSFKEREDRLRKQLARCKEQRNQFRNSLSNSFNVIPSIKSLDAELAKLEE